jgi:hypothetical protein
MSAALPAANDDWSLEQLKKALEEEKERTLCLQRDFAELQSY